MTSTHSEQTRPKVIFINDCDDPRLIPYMNIREKDLVGRQGQFIAEGKVVINVLLASKTYQPVSLLVTRNKLPGLDDQIARWPLGAPILCVSQDIMDKIAGFNVHRGILAIAQRQQLETDNQAIIDTSKDNALVVVLNNIANHDNMGAIFRNAAAFEADGVLMDETCCDPLYRKAIRVSVGATLKTAWHKGGKISEIIDDLKQQGFRIIAFSPSARDNLYDKNRTGKLALLFGTEGAGLPSYLLETLETASIPMSHNFDSLNVAVSSGIALSYFRQDNFA